MVFLRSDKRKLLEDDTARAMKKGRGHDKNPKGPPSQLMSSIQPNDLPRKYRHIEENCGGTYTIDEEMPFIGTDNCVTCLGVYFAIDHDRCFFAHINIEPRLVDGSQVPEVDRSLRDYEINATTERAIVWWVKRQLNNESWSESWGPITQMMRDTLIACCPNSNLSNITMVGDAAFRSVMEFLGIDDSERHPLQAAGFAVKHTGASFPQIVLFPVEQYDWEAVVEGPEGESSDAAWGWSDIRRDGVVWHPAQEAKQATTEGPYLTPTG